jgi:hypothetical protein
MLSHYLTSPRALLSKPPIVQAGQRVEMGGRLGPAIMGRLAVRGAAQGPCIVENAGFM